MPWLSTVWFISRTWDTNQMNGQDDFLNYLTLTGSKA